LTEMNARLGTHTLPTRAQRWLEFLAVPMEGQPSDDLCSALTEEKEALLCATPTTDTATAAETLTSVPAIRARIQEAEAEVASELAAVRIALRQPTLTWKSLKVGPTSTLHNLVEVPTVSRTNKSPRWNVPSDWVLVNSTLLACRFHTPHTVTLQVRPWTFLSFCSHTHVHRTIPAHCPTLPPLPYQLIIDTSGVAAGGAETCVSRMLASAVGTGGCRHACSSSHQHGSTRGAGCSGVLGQGNTSIYTSTSTSTSSTMTNPPSQYHFRH
jgi:hypothetical protein